MYFNSHPLIIYDNNEVVDIFRKIVPIKGLLKNALLFQSYDIKDRETPELLAYKIYGSTEYHWILLMVNNIINVNTDWVKSTQDFSNFVNLKYDDPDEVHHYEDADGDIIDEPETPEEKADASVSNYTYEERINNARGVIKILKPEYLNPFVENFKSLL